MTVIGITHNKKYIKIVIFRIYFIVYQKYFIINANPKFSNFLKIGKWK